MHGPYGINDESATAPDWLIEQPEAHGLDAEKLHEAAALVRAIEKRYGFLVIKDKAIVHETYYQGDATSRHAIFSIAKGFGSSLIGIAQSRGYLSAKDKISDWLPVHHPDIKDTATIAHVMAMTAANDPQNPMADTFRYASGAILNTLPDILQRATGRSPARFFDEELAAPLKLTLDWPRTEEGWMQIGDYGPMPVVRSTHRDVAKLGQLWLEKGVWNGQRLINEDYIEAALTPPFPQTNNAYGYLWWLNKDGGIWRDIRTQAGVSSGKRIPNAPENVFSALGARGKMMLVIPDHNMVVVTLGETPGSIQSTLDLWAAVERILPA